MACSGLERCESGQCTCPPELPDSCGAGRCTDLDADRANCGGCGRTCDPGFVCSAGTCVPDCQGGQTACPLAAPSFCADLQTDAANCGACGARCVGLRRCVQGNCVCPPELPDECTPGACTNVAEDDEHCGACGLRCDVGRACYGGSCQCVPPLAECGGACVDLRTDSNHCGSCSVRCPLVSSCSLGTCTARCLGTLGFPGVPSLPISTRVGVYTFVDQVVAGDLDGDGTPDLVASNGAELSTVVYRGNGDGTLTVRQLIPEWVHDMRLVDFNEDGRLDVVGTAIHGLCWLTNQGGTLDVQGYFDFANCSAMALADFNGDGEIDYACRSKLNKPSAFVLLNWGPQTTVGAQGQCESLVSGDFDGDGDQDIACASTTTQRLVVFLNDGTATFTVGPESDVGAKPSLSAAVDLDGEGQLELLGFVQGAGTTSDELVLLRNTGGGAFVAELLGEASRCKPHLADMDVDGLEDIVVCRDVFYATGAGHFVQATDQLAASAVEVTDLNLDGWPDVVGSSGEVLLNDLAGHFVAPQPLAGRAEAIATGPNHAPQVIQVPGPPFVLTGLAARAGSWLPAWTQPIAGFNFGTLVAGDYDHDGTSDLFLADESSLLVVLAGADGAPVSTTSVPLPDGVSRYAIGDLNGDGLADVALLTKDAKRLDVLLSTGWLTFAQQSLWSGEDLGPAIVADLDRDGRPDLAVVDPNQQQLLVFLNGPTGLAAPVAHAVGSTLLRRSWTAASGDVDGDGDLDVVLVGDSKLLLLVRNGGTGQFGIAEQIAPGSDKSLATLVVDMALVDLDGDGDLDLVQGSYFIGAVVYLNDGQGGFEYGGRFGGFGGPYLGISDLDGDLRPDIAWGWSILYNRCLP
ncbi:MAG: FG-GAP-like repeat-containing protein [Myxococcales bacterium]